jgi:D-serine deaminase-like pyridoxal phosphate-dependent protein
VRAASSRRRAVVGGPVSSAKATVAKLAAAGFGCPVVTGGGTGTYPFEIEGGVHTELQPGSFLFMDGDYNRNETPLGTPVFKQSLFVHATVISANQVDGRRVLDAGSKAVDLVSGPPTLAVQAARESSASPLASAVGATSMSAPMTSSSESGLLGLNATTAGWATAVTFRAGGDEHGILENVPQGELPIGATVRLVPSHCDPTVNLHTDFIGFEGGVCSHIFPIEARGPCW